MGIVVFLSGLSVLASGVDFMAPQRATDPASKAATANAIRKQVSQQVSTNFLMSLEMRENVDFLLTPALLVQEAISEGVIITYPEQ